MSDRPHLCIKTPDGVVTKVASYGDIFDDPNNKIVFTDTRNDDGDKQTIVGVKEVPTPTI
jgi:hypothetical protein